MIILLFTYFNNLILAQTFAPIHTYVQLYICVFVRLLCKRRILINKKALGVYTRAAQYVVVRISIKKKLRISQ